jgi:subtilisin family serine protease
MRTATAMVTWLAIGAAVVRPALAAPPASGRPGVGIVRALGPNALAAFAPRGAPGMGALVRLPAGVRAADWGLTQAAPGIASFWGQPSGLLAFAAAHPSAGIEVNPPLRPLLDTALGFVDGSKAQEAGLDGTGVAVGVADTGLDVTHGDFLDATGHTRVAWLLDLSSPPRGVHPDLESMFGTRDAKMNLVFGAVWSGAEIDQTSAFGATSSLPQDPSGHGTLVTSCAAGNGEGGTSKYRGVAPAATLLVARITDAGEDIIGNAELLQGVAFLMNRADALALPVVVNLSIGTDFGPHDGTTAWEETIASYVGPDHPGHAVVVAAGNSGSIAGVPVHQNVHVSAGTTMRVPITTQGAQSSGGVQVWVAIHGGASLKIGLDKPGGTWVDPVPPGQSGGSSDQIAGIDNGSQPPNSMVPADSNGAIVAWQGAWPSGTYYVTLDGTATVDLYVQATGDAAIPGVTQVAFAQGVREGTIGLPATHPDLIGVGCTINKPAWKDMRGFDIGVPVPLLDLAGGEVDPSGAERAAEPGEPCWFSGAGPTLTGAFKPDIMAPGAAIVGALSAQAVPPAPLSIFTSASCPPVPGGDAACQQVDATHAVALGTSFSSPIVAGTVALMLQHDPQLTEDAIISALQGGAHPLRGPAPFADQAGPGEVDVLGAIGAVDRMLDPATALPVKSQSWLSLGSALYLADGSTPMEAILELRAAPSGTALARPADGFAAARLTVYAEIDGALATGVLGTPVRRGPGVWTVAVQPLGGLGGSTLTVGARFDGVDIVDRVSLPIATDAWNAIYPSGIRGGCTLGPGPNGRGGWVLVAFAAALGLLERRRMNGRQARRLGAGRLARAVEGHLEDHRTDHLV